MEMTQNQGKTFRQILVRQYVREKIDAPNTPNPANPNAQDQFVDVVQGLVAPAPQVFYQNWIGKKSEFSSKPEEDAESHLLSTRDWMEAHNFPDEAKVRHF